MDRKAKAVTLPEPNTTQETAWFAELCGLEIVHQAKDTLSAFRKSDGKKWLDFNPRTSIADVIELAESAGLRVLQQLRSGEWGVWAPIGVNGWTLSKIDDDLCTAICEAVRAKGGDDAVTPNRHR